MSKNINKYRLVYAHLWQTYGQSRKLRASYLIHLATRILKLIVQPIAVSTVITSLAHQDYTGARHAVFLFLGMSAGIGVLTPLSKYIGMLGENKSYRDITAHYFSKLITADLDYFNNNLAGYLTTATRQYVDSCMELVRAIRDRYTNTVLSIMFPLVVIAWYDPVLGAIALLLSVILAAYLLTGSRLIGPFRTRGREVYRYNSGRMADIVSNILAVKATAQEKDSIRQVRDGSEEEGRVYYKRYAMQVKIISVRELLTVSFFVVLLLTTLDRMKSGSITLNVAVLVFTYSTVILTGIFVLSDDIDQHDDYIDKIIPAFEILNRKNTIADPKHPKKMQSVRGKITFKNVRFSYDQGDPDQSVFKDFTLTIPAGQKVGVVGLSGAGKSTLAKLVMRFNDVDTGSVLLDGVNIKEMSQTDLRSHIAYVPQEPLLFHSSVRENVLLGKPHASEKQVANALKAAHADTFISHLPDGLNSIVGERGVKLSGGQKQRIAIARAVLQDCPIVVLDEATSALDSESEQIIKDSFAEVLNGKTAIVIAHRLSTLSDMDRIVVIEKGKLTEDGTHEQLLAKNATYARLWRRQQRHLETF